MNDERVQTLLDRYFDQLLTVEERTELEQTLLESASARESFWESARWNALIRQWGQAEWGRREAMQGQEPRRVVPLPPKAVAGTPKPASRSKSIGSRVPWWPLASAAVAMFAFVFTWLNFSPIRNEPPPTIAVLTRATGVIWADGSATPQIGEALQPGWLRLKSGAVLIEFSRGAHVVLEGPAEFQLVGANEAVLRTGKVRARVPEPAHGFKIRGGEFSVVDYGTEFGCLVPLAGAVEVHVFMGSVGLETSTTTHEPLRENQAVRLAKDGQPQPIPVNRAVFLDEEELTRREMAGAKDQLAAWRQSSDALSTHPAMLLHLDFERSEGRSLPNRARNAPPDSGATIVGCEWVEGRWPGKGALEFSGPEDRLRLSLPGESKSLTLLAWVRVQSLPNAQNSLLMGESFKPGEVHWYLYHDGALGLGVRSADGNPGAWRTSHSRPVVTAETFGSWLFLASTFDGATGTVSHYLNGQPIGSERLGTRLPLLLGTFEIGNWGVQAKAPEWAWAPVRSPRDYARNLRGRIDEFSVLSSALPAEEIRNLYKQVQFNRP